ncbi:5-formyltetrahydrofolate cyclo-ligase, mitochondrial-like isoform X1 [Spinacia oleracea]|uniref:5-formyltetrahydrofolate cyclo-ligase, mitochondrial-like isoform X1 n=1 Tax=Spinacia oleracea TaxID=3562 RepID=A0ABM3QGS7_SPIOL|nr:5-formyltetrahydrofolate cyclo-ligase, mitochondrial-like isoform X1 [Spinacia oleracea]
MSVAVSKLPPFPMPMLLHQLRTLSSSSSSRCFSSSLSMRRSTSSSPSLSCFPRSFTTTVKNDGGHENDLHIEEIFAKKRSLRTQIRKQLKNMSPDQRTEEDNTIQHAVLEAHWFQSANGLCAYVNCDALREVDTSKFLSKILCNEAKEHYKCYLSKKKKHYKCYVASNQCVGMEVLNAFSSEDKCSKNRKKLFLPRIEDRNSNMKMLRVSSYDDLIPNSMNILEPTLQDHDGNEREDLMQASEPVDLFILPGLAFDKSGRRLGRSGGYYDVYLKKYFEIAEKRKWKPPLIVALSYSMQIVEDGSIGVTSDDIPVDALVCPAGVIYTNEVERIDNFGLISLGINVLTCRNVYILAEYSGIWGISL